MPHCTVGSGWPCCSYFVKARYRFACIRGTGGSPLIGILICSKLQVIQMLLIAVACCCLKEGLAQSKVSFDSRGAQGLGVCITLCLLRRPSSLDCTRANNLCHTSAVARALYKCCQRGLLGSWCNLDWGCAQHSFNPPTSLYG